MKWKTPAVEEVRIPHLAYIRSTYLPTPKQFIRRKLLVVALSWAEEGLAENMGPPKTLLD
jgi:hypothetical protein